MFSRNAHMTYSGPAHTPWNFTWSSEWWDILSAEVVTWSCCKVNWLPFRKKLWRNKVNREQKDETRYFGNMIWIPESSCSWRWCCSTAFQLQKPTHFLFCQVGSGFSVIYRQMSQGSHFMGNRWENSGNSGNSGWLYFSGLQNHCRWWLQQWN